MGTVEQNSLTPNSRICVALETYEQESPKIQQHDIIIVWRKKLVMHIEQEQCDKAKWNEK